MPENITKASDTDIAITTTQIQTISLVQMKNRLKNLNNQMTSLQGDIDLVNSRISQAIALGVTDIPIQTPVNIHSTP